jgi:hypothetical protein
VNKTSLHLCCPHTTGTSTDSSYKLQPSSGCVQLLMLHVCVAVSCHLLTMDARLDRVAFMVSKVSMGQVFLQALLFLCPHYSISTSYSHIIRDWYSWPIYGHSTKRLGAMPLLQLKKNYTYLYFGFIGQILSHLYE